MGVEGGGKKEIVEDIGGRGEEEELIEKVMELGKRGDGRLLGRVGVWEREEKGKMGRVESWEGVGEKM